MKKKFRGGAGDLLNEVMKRMSVSGMGELRIPRDALALLQSNVDKILTKAASKIDMNKLLEDLVRGYKIRISAEVNLVPKERRPKKKRK